MRLSILLHLSVHHHRLSLILILRQDLTVIELLRHTYFPLFERIFIERVLVIICITEGINHGSLRSGLVLLISEHFIEFVIDAQ